MSRKPHRALLKSQAKEIIAKVYDFMKLEANNNYAARITDARWRTAQAVEVSERTVTRILSERRAHAIKQNVVPDTESNAAKATNEFIATHPSIKVEIEPCTDSDTESKHERKLNSMSRTDSIFKSPSKRRKLGPRKINLDEFDVGEVRKIIRNYHTEHDQLPSLSCLKNIFIERIQYDGSTATLRRLLHKLGYKWRTKKNRTIITEKHNIQMLRLKYLKQVKSFRDEGRPIVYADETCIHTSYVRTKSYSDRKSKVGIKQNVTKGVRIIIVHAGSKEGFIPNALLTYRPEIKSGDYHGSMNTENYLKWLKEKLIPNLPNDAVVVLDNEAYNNSSSEKIPTSNSTKVEMQSWLTTKNITFEPNSKKPELYDSILKNKRSYRTYKVDDLLKEHGYTVLRLPPNHPDLNPIKNIWSIVKNDVGSRTVDQNYNSFVSILNEAIDRIYKNIWITTFQDVEKIEDEYLEHCDLDINFTTDVTGTSDSETNISESSEDAM